MSRDPKQRGPIGRIVDRLLLGPEDGRDGPDPDMPRGGERWRYEDNTHEHDTDGDDR